MASTAVSAARLILRAAASISRERCRASARLAGRERRLLPYQYRAADAWPLLGFAGGMEKFDELLLAGGPTLEPRLAQTPGPAALAAGRIPRIDLREPAGRGPEFFETAAKHKHLAAAE
jgi:hypothetical protein